MIVMSIAFSSNVNLEEAFSPVNVWDAKIYNRLKAMNIVIPPKMDNIKNEKIIGAFVKEPDPIKYGYVVSEDLNSLYPRILVQYNMSTETLIDKHQRYKLLLDELNKRGLKYEASF
jgi:DNA polymerase elongation subunit (family B)